jgi:hypothetical protein
MARINLQGYNGFPHNMKQFRWRVLCFSLHYVLKLEFKNVQSTTVRSILTVAG